MALYNLISSVRLQSDIISSATTSAMCCMLSSA